MAVDATLFESDLPSAVSAGEPLAPLTWFGLGGPAKWMARPTNLAELGTLVSRCREESIDLVVLGEGANLLVDDEGVDGMVVRLNRPWFRDMKFEETAGGDEVRVTARGGADMARLALDAVRNGVTGLECMAGIPGTLGGIVRMNAGGKFGQIADVVEQVTLMTPTGQVEQWGPDKLGFAYRRSNIGRNIVTEVQLKLKRDDPARIRGRWLDIWSFKKKSQPLRDSCAGCIFKNPPGDSAGRLIDAAGLKGRTVGGASVSQEHANFVVTKEGATASNVLELIRQVQHEVAEQFAVALELEIEVWGQGAGKRFEQAA